MYHFYENANVKDQGGKEEIPPKRKVQAVIGMMTPVSRSTKLKKKDTKVVLGYNKHVTYKDFVS